MPAFLRGTIMYLSPRAFRSRFPAVKGKLYGGWHPADVRIMQTVMRAMNRCRRPWTFTNESCGEYIQRRIYVAR